MDEKIVPLKWPIPIPKEGGGTVDVRELKLGRLKAKHFKLLPKDFMSNEGQVEPSALIPLLAGIADIPEESADEIDMEDLMEVAESLQDFLGEFLETGKK
jgi:hypothetical protein